MDDAQVRHGPRVGQVPEDRTRCPVMDVGRWTWASGYFAWHAAILESDRSRKADDDDAQHDAQHACPIGP